jgi:hypothetical protein
MADDGVIDIRESAFQLTADELAALRCIVDRNVIDVSDIGRSLGTSDEAVLSVLRAVAVKLAEFHYLAANETPPLGHQQLEIRARSRRRAVAPRARRNQS